jgi:hypothetical protein
LKRDFLKKGVVLTMVVCLTFPNCVFAGTTKSGNNVKMTDIYIKGDSYSSVVRGYKATENRTLSVLVDKMLKDDGDSSSYKYSWWQVVNVTQGTVLNSGVKATKGTVCKINLSEKTLKTNKLSVNAKGNASKRDAIVNGYIYDFSK